MVGRSGTWGLPPAGFAPKVAERGGVAGEGDEEAAAHRRYLCAGAAGPRALRTAREPAALPVRRGTLSTVGRRVAGTSPVHFQTRHAFQPQPTGRSCRAALGRVVLG